MIIFTIKFLDLFRNLKLTNQKNNEYMNVVYKTNIYSLHLSLWVKTNGPSVAAIGPFCPQQNSTIAVTSGP